MACCERPPQYPPATPSAMRLRMGTFHPASRNCPPAPTAASLRARYRCLPSTPAPTTMVCLPQYLIRWTRSSSSRPRPLTVPLCPLVSSSWILASSATPRRPSAKTSLTPDSPLLSGGTPALRLGFRLGRIKSYRSFGGVMSRMAGGRVLSALGGRRMTDGCGPGGGGGAAAP
eukprot:6488808-Amphidinium_carterae.6